MMFYFGKKFEKALVRKETVILSKEQKSFENLRLLFVTDIHMARYFTHGQTEKLARQINELKPDLILAGGDFYEGSEYIPDVCAFAASLSAPLGAFAVPGNNDIENWRYQGEPLPKLLKRNGMTMLKKSAAVLKMEKGKICIYGLDVLNRKKPDRYENIFASAAKKDLCIVLSHYPQLLYLQKDAFARKPDIALSGHTHGGQFNVFGLTPYSIGFERGRKGYLMPVYGTTDKCGFHTIISSGIGSSRVPFRFNVKPEIVLIELKTGEQK